MLRYSINTVLWPELEVFADTLTEGYRGQNKPPAGHPLGFMPLKWLRLQTQPQNSELLAKTNFTTYRTYPTNTDTEKNIK